MTEVVPFDFAAPPKNDGWSWDRKRRFSCWLASRNVLHDEKHIELSFNDIYSFWDLKIFPVVGEELDEFAVRLLALFHAEELELQYEERTWRWVQRTDVMGTYQVWGLRVWIKPRMT